MTSRKMKNIVKAALTLTAVVILGRGNLAHAKDDGSGTAAVNGQRSQPAGKSKAATLPPGTFQAKQMVRDLDRSVAFYGRVFEIFPAMRFKSVMNHRPMEEVLFSFANGDHVPLVLIKFLDDGALSHDQTVHVFFTDDIDALVERVEQNGGRVTERRDDTQHRVRIAFWYDPEGNLLETVEMY